MSYLREIEYRRAEIIGMRTLLEGMPDDPLAKPLLTSRLHEVEAELAAFERQVPMHPEAELLFAGRPVIGSVGLDAKFASRVLDAYQDMVANHYSASRHGTVGSRGPRTKEDESRLCLTALPRGSFGLLLEQPQSEDFIAAAQLSDVMDEITSLVEAAAGGDAAFSEAVERFHPRVVQPLERFLTVLEAQEASVTLRSGTRQCQLTVAQVVDAKRRVADTTPVEDNVQLLGICRGILLESWKFDFNPEGLPPISGSLSASVTESEALQMLNLVNQPAEATMRRTRMHTRTAIGKPTYELLTLKARGTPPPP